MSWIAVAGLAVTAVGTAVSAKGAADNADAMAKANANAGNSEDAFFGRQSGYLDTLIDKKNNKLKNLGNIFERFNSTGAFGDTNTLKNLRKAQEDYSALAAGDFSGFESQLRQSLSDSLIATAGSGAPIGTFAGLAAQDQMNLRGQGIQTSMGISDYLSKEANQLLGQEFGIMDQRFNTQYQMDRTKVTNVNNYALGQAGTVGVATQAYGQAAQQVGSSIASYGMFQQNQKTIANSNFNAMASAQGGIQRAGIVNSDGSVSQSSYFGRPSVSSYGNLNSARSSAAQPSFPVSYLGDPPQDSISEVDILLPSPYNSNPVSNPSLRTYSPIDYSNPNYNGISNRNQEYYSSLYQPSLYGSQSSLLSSIGARIASQ